MILEINEWLNLVLRWFHVIAGIAWIGSSFYFMWLDAEIKRPENAKPGVEGEVWMVHGGGFYRVDKFMVAPAEMPEKLHWFKWEAALTWLSGFALLALIYYAGAATYMVDPTIADISPTTAVLIGLATLGLAWLIYDILWESPLAENDMLAIGLSCLLFVGVVYGLHQAISARAAYTHVGAVLGTLMVANVWVRIIPAQRLITAALIAGRRPSETEAKKAVSAKRRSTHNNYMTLPVIFVMISGHYPATYGHPYNWLILIGLSLASAWIRHWFNLHEKGENKPWILVSGAAAFVLLIVAIVHTRPAGMVTTAGARTVEFGEVRAVIAQRCVTCHSARPTDDDFREPPQGFVLDTPDQIRRQAQKINARVVLTQTMPPANKTAMTDDERQLVADWIAQGARIQ